MKKFYTLLPLLALPLVFIFIGFSAGSPGGRTGSPGDNANNCTACHSGTAQNASDWISSDVPENGYVGGETYIITATGNHAGVGKFGFELTAEDASGNKTGTFALVNATETQLANNSQSVTHTQQGNTPDGDNKTWELQWTAPDEVPGDITFYAAFNAANGNGSTSGDVIYLSEVTYGPDVTGIANIKQDFSFYPNPSTGIVNIENQGITNTSVRVFNQTGQVVKVLDITESLAQLDLTSQARGVYFVQIGETSMQKLILR
jgi:hypothetical protein